MEKITETVNRIVASPTGTLAPLTIPQSIEDHDWGYEAHNTETFEAYTAVTEWLARMVRDSKARKAENARHEAEVTAEYDQAVAVWRQGDGTAQPPRRRQAKIIRPEGEWLTLCGESGCGKTHLAHKVAEWRGAGVFYRWLDLISKARNGDVNAITRRADDPKLMVIDDIGAGYDTDFSNALLAEITERRSGLYTMFTSNLNNRQLAEIDTRIASRMIRGKNTVFEFTETGDYALRK